MPRDKRNVAPHTADAPHPPAPLWRRFAAMAYDALLLVALWFVLTGVFMMVQGMIVGEDALRIQAESGGFDRNPGLGSLLFVATFLFFGWFWRKSGQTLGMQAWRIKIVSEYAYPLRWTQCLLRFVMAALAALPFGLGYLWMLWDREGKTWQDRYSMTRTILLPPPGKADRDQPPSGRKG